MECIRNQTVTKTVKTVVDGPVLDGFAVRDVNVYSSCENDLRLVHGDDGHDLGVYEPDALRELAAAFDELADTLESMEHSD